MAQLAVQKVAQTGLNPSFVAADAGGDTFQTAAPPKQTFLVVKNGGGSPITVTIDSVRPCDQGFDHDLVVSVPNAGERWIGPVTTERFGANASVTYSGVTSVTVAAVEVG